MSYRRQGSGWRWWTVIVWLMATAAGAQEPYTARVVGISDGDTLTVLTGAKTDVKIRLAEIDTPEKGQPFGRNAKQALAELCGGQVATVKPQTTDRYGRTVARVECQGRDASTELLRAGMAWVFDKYVTDRSLYALQTTAREAKVGLWGDANAVAPWEWRAAKRRGKDCAKDPVKCVETAEEN